MRLPTCPRCGAPVFAGPGGGGVRCGSCGAPLPSPGRHGPTYTVVLVDPGPYKVQVVKVIRDLTGAGLREAAGLARTGGTVLEGVSEAVAHAAQAGLEAVGARVRVE